MSVGYNMELLTISQIAKYVNIRKTFKGIIIYSQQACEDGNCKLTKETYIINYNQNLKTKEVVRLLRILADSLERAEAS